VSSSGSVSHWIDQLKAGEHAAAEELWDRYFQRLVGLAHKMLQGTSRHAADEEDVALSAFASLCLGAERGRFPRLLDRQDLWQLLLVITRRKALRQVHYERRQKRGGPSLALQACADTSLKRQRREVPPEADAGPEEASLVQILSREPTPAFAAQVAEEYQRLLELLGDPELRAIAVYKMEGDTTDQIAAKLKRAPRTVERRVQLIRKLWEKELPV
jgi:DNA-directed RNA polymerase specialized sigma24 family protein